MALALSIHHPERVNKLILMGSVGVPFELTPGLDAVWGYTPSEDNMRAIMRIFAYDQKLVGDDLVRMRYEASRRAGVQEAYAAMFRHARRAVAQPVLHRHHCASGLVDIRLRRASAVGGAANLRGGAGWCLKDGRRGRRQLRYGNPPRPHLGLRPPVPAHVPIPPIAGWRHRFAG